MKKITVIGSDGSISPDLVRMAELVGQKIAEAGCVLLCGGKNGVMEAACRGAKKKNGLTVGVLPSKDGFEANKHVDLVLPTGMGYARNYLLVSFGDAVVALNGSSGTLSEISMAVNLGKPVFVVEGSGGVSEGVLCVSSDERISKIRLCKAEKVVDACLEAIG